MRLIYICILLVIHSLSAAEIIVTSDFERIEKETARLDENSLLLFDVDATLIVPKDAILKPQVKELFNQLIANYSDRDLFREIRMKAPHELVDHRSLCLIHQLQQNKVPVLALTAAPPKTRESEEPGVWRVNELLKFGFDFSHAFPDLDYLELPRDVNQQRVPLFKSGVLYSFFQPKGDVLRTFLLHLGLKPNRIVFVDDEFEHVRSVTTSLDKLGIPCTGIHYTAVEELPCEIHWEHAQTQISHFIEHDIWLNDLKDK